MAFDPSLVPDSQKLKLALDSTPISADQTDFPLTDVLDGSDPLHAAVFEELLWTPNQLSTIFQIDPADDGSVTLDGGAVSQINDLSGNDYHCTQSTAGARPSILSSELNGMDVLSADGSDSLLADSSSLGSLRNKDYAWAIVVYRKNTADAENNRVLFSFQANNDATSRFQIGSGYSGYSGPYVGGRRLDGDDWNYAAASTEFYDQWVIAVGEIDYQARTITLHVNGEKVGETTGAFSGAGSTSDTDSSSISLLSQGQDINPVIGKVAGAVAGNTELSQDDRQRLEGFYAHKFNLTASLPSDHPYKTSAPAVPKKLSIQSGTTQLPVEIEHWDEVNQKAVLHTKVPTYAAAADGELILSYDSSQEDNDDYVGETGSTPAQSVWDSNFAAVYHMAQDPSGGAGCILDSTANANHGTPAGSMTSDDLVDGMYGKALDFDGTDDYVDLNAKLIDHSGDRTIEAFYNTMVETGQTLYSDVYHHTTSVGTWIYLRSDSDEIRIYEVRGVSNQAPLYPIGATFGFYDGDWHQFAFVWDGTATANSAKIYNDGTVALQATASYPAISATSQYNSRLGGHYDDSGFLSFPLSGKISEFRISNTVRSDDWIKLTHLSLTDQLITWSAYGAGESFSGSQGPIPIPVVRQIVDLHYALYGPRAVVSLEYGLLTNVRNIVNIIYGIKLAAIVELLYGNTPIVRQRVVLPYGDAARLVRIIQLRYGDTAQFRQVVDLLYNVQGDIRQIVDLNYSITEDQLRAIIELKYDLRVYDEWRKIIDIIYGIASGETLEEVTTLAFTTGDGTALDPFHVNIEKEEGKGFDVAFKTHREIDYEACIPPVRSGTTWNVTTVQVQVNSDTYTVVVEERDITREQPEAQYEISMRSQLFLLDAPYAQTISEELSGMAQSIVEDLLTRELPAATLTWSMVNWYIQVNVLTAADQTPLELIQQIVEAGGGVVEADKDGNMVCRPKWPVNLPDYTDETPALYLTDQDNFYTVASQTMKKPGYNNFFISDQTPSAEGLTIEVREVSATRKEVLVFQVPWESDDIRLRTSGGSHVQVQNNGVVVELIEDEIVEIVDGQGQSEYPIYQKVSHDYRETSLGSVTTEEDGTIQTSTVHNSLIALTYRTRYHKFTVVDSQIESVQFWPEII
jgi:hypothetical protein